MKSSPHDLLQEASEEIVESVFRRIHGSSVHYQTADEDVLRRRCKKLVQTFVESTHGAPYDLASYAREITEERISEGYHLHEIQLVLSILEKKAWAICVENIPQRDDLVRALSLITGIIGNAKDQLAGVYLEHHESAVARLAALETQPSFTL